MFDVFSGMGKAKQFNDPVYFRSKQMPDGTWTQHEGDYLLTVTRLEHFATREGQPRITAEFRVDAVLRETPSSHKAGTRVKEMWRTDITPMQTFTDMGAMEMGRATSFFKAAFAQVGVEVTAENCGLLAKAATEAAMTGAAGSPLGMQVVCNLYKTKPSKKTGKVYDEQKFSAPPKA